MIRVWFNIITQKCFFPEVFCSRSKHNCRQHKKHDLPMHHKIVLKIFLS